MSITTKDLKDVPDGDRVLDPNVYDFKVTQARAITYEKDGDTIPALSIRAVCIGGPSQEDGMEPEDTEIDDFFPMGGYDAMKDGGTFVKQRRKAFLTACLGELDGSDIDESDLVGEEFKARTSKGKDRDGIAITKIARYLVGVVE